MKRLLALTIIVAVVLAACSTYYVQPPPGKNRCAVCGYAQFAMRLTPAHWPMFLNGTLRQFDEPTLLAKCLRCGYAFPFGDDGKPAKLWK
jgi:hypothetical protein